MSPSKHSGDLDGGAAEFHPGFPFLYFVNYSSMRMTGSWCRMRVMTFQLQHMGKEKLKEHLKVAEQFLKRLLG
jgi:hypothetical protein